MNNTIIVFSDEAGQYHQNANKKNIISAPFYIRSGVFISTEDYIAFQDYTLRLKEQYGVPLNQEIKWSDIYEIQKKRYREHFLMQYDDESIMSYIASYLRYAAELQSLKYVFTITQNHLNSFADKNYILYAHLQNIYQRAQLEASASNKNFYIVIIDDMDKGTIEYLREKCGDLLRNGDRFLQYGNINHSLLVENSKQSAGIQLADYSAGIFNSIAKKYILSAGGYQYSNDMYDRYIAPHIRNVNRQVVGYGIIKVTNKNNCDLTELISRTQKHL